MCVEWQQTALRQKADAAGRSHECSTRHVSGAARLAALLGGASCCPDFCQNVLKEFMTVQVLGADCGRVSGEAPCPAAPARLAGCAGEPQACLAFVEHVSDQPARQQSGSSHEAGKLTSRSSCHCPYSNDMHFITGRSIRQPDCSAPPMHMLCHAGKPLPSIGRASSARSRALSTACTWTTPAWSCTTGCWTRSRGPPPCASGAHP